MNVVRAAVLAAALLALGACVPICGIGAHLTLSNAQVDSGYKCPNPSSDRPYDIHGSIDVDNYTSNNVTIKSMSEAWQLVSSGGHWSGPKNAKGGSGVTNYQPRSISAGDKLTVKFVIGFGCTNSNAGPTTFGDFTFKLTLVTTNGTYTVAVGDHHRLTFA